MNSNHSSGQQSIFNAIRQFLIVGGLVAVLVMIAALVVTSSWTV